MTTNLEKTYVKNIYELIADHFNNTRFHTWSWIKEFIEKFPKNSLIGDIGCGNGRNMNNKYYTFIGIDNCKKFIEICRSKRLNVIEANITNIPLKNNCFDAIICIAVFHHLYKKEDKIKSLLELKRLIKDNGEILLSVWSINQPVKTKRSFTKYGNNIVEWNKFGKIYERYYYIFELNELKELFKIAGLHIKKYNYDCGNEIFILIKN